MAVASQGAALSAFRELIKQDQVEARMILRQPYLPHGLEPSDDPVRMSPSTLIGVMATKHVTRSVPQIRTRWGSSFGRRRLCCMAVRRSAATGSRSMCREVSISPWRVVPLQVSSVHSPFASWPPTSGSATLAAHRPVRLPPGSQQRPSLVATIGC
jgi:hypothetical protein